jgi:hypothetical protein
MYIKFNEGIFLVDGHVNSCIYDTRNEQVKLYHIDNEAVVYIKQCASSGFDDKNISYEELSDCV